MSREIVADSRKLLIRFGDEPPERFFYRGETLSQESENLIGRGLNIFENGGNSIQRKVQYLRSLGDIPEGGRPSVVREFQRDSDCFSDCGGELSFLRSGRHRLGMRTLGCVRPRDAALTLAMETHFSKCESRLAFCHVCTGYFSALTGSVENVGVLARAQVSTRRIVVREGVAGLESVIQGSDTNAGSCKRVRTEDSVVFQLASKRFRRSDFGLEKAVFLEDRLYGNEVVADCKFTLLFSITFWSPFRVIKTSIFCFLRN
jgi:hypothetical protein